MQKFEEYKKKVNESLKNFLDNKLEKEGKYSVHTKEMIRNIIEFNMREAKRIRPITTIFGYKCFKNDEKIVGPSISIELMQAYLLIHDDIIDKSNLRRGKPSLHKIQEGNSGEDFGINMAILSGNICASYMYESILESDFANSEKIEAIRYLSWINNRENYGQALDLVQGIKNVTEEEVIKIYELKTATYTIMGPLYLGCALANAPKEKVSELQKYAYNVGVSFQIQDDVNGILSSEAEIGKTNDSDVKEGKKTLIIIKALELCNEDEKKFILEKYGKENILPEEIERMRKIIRNCGAYDYCKREIERFIEEAKVSIKDIELRDEGKNFLLEMADYIKGMMPN
jgi:geranylgeranyl diphosphate synthase, type I